ncbi:MAG: Rho termination factor N-terminal domain-containing protein [Desulfobacterales bacterium]|jgi:protein-arginine kinase activator protein McsA
MSENPEETGQKPGKAADTGKETQAAAAKEDNAAEKAQEDAAHSEDTVEATGEKPAKAPQESSPTKDKPLEKMTVKELREIAKDMPGLTGVHAMKKDDLISGIKAAKGIKDEPVKKASRSMRELKLQIKALKAERQAALEAKDKKKATIFRRRISRLKKKTRKVAA